MVIIGGAESGIGAAILAQQQGFDVFVSDGGIIKDQFKKELLFFEIPFEEGKHSLEKILNCDEVVKSPGIADKAPLIKMIRERNIPVISEVELAFRFKGNSKLIAVTGSNGKTTTASLIYHICKHAGMDCALVGNIGISFAKQVALQPKEIYVAEISSFQLDDIMTFKPDVAVLTNITEDHLDRYDYNIQNYIDSKFKIAQNQEAGDVFIYNLDDENTIGNISKFNIKSLLAPITMSKELPQGAYLTNEQLHLKWKGEDMQMSIDDFALKGKHNQYNSMAASMTATAVDIRKDKIREALQTFESLEHRMETVSVVRGITFINDSKATNVNSAWFALESMNSPVILILGGVDKGNDYNLLKELVQEKVKAIICMGTDNNKIHDAFGDIVPLMVDTSNASDAVQAAYELGKKGDVVLLSPACASFDDCRRNRQISSLQ